MITLTFIFCAVLPFILVFIISKVIIRLVEKLLDFTIETVFSLPEKILDSIKAKFTGVKEKNVIADKKD